jgi:hypothetical protein
MPEVGFKPEIPASERPQTHALDRAATGIGSVWLYGLEFCMIARNVLLYQYYADFCIILLCEILYDRWWSGFLYDVWCGPLYELVASISVWLFHRNFIYWGNPFSGKLLADTQTYTERIEGDRISSLRAVRQCGVTHVQNTYKVLNTAQPSPPLHNSKIKKRIFLDYPVHANLPLLSSLPLGAANLSLYVLKSLPSGESRVLTYSSLLCRSHGSPDCVSDSVLPSKTSTLHNDVTQTILTLLPWILKRSVSWYRKLPKLHHCTL